MILMIRWHDLVMKFSPKTSKQNPIEMLVEKIFDQNEKMYDIEALIPIYSTPTWFISELFLTHLQEEL